MQLLSQYFGRDPALQLSPVDGLVIGGYSLNLLVENIPLVTDTSNMLVTVAGATAAVTSARCSAPSSTRALTSGASHGAAR